MISMRCGVIPIATPPFLTCLLLLLFTDGSLQGKEAIRAGRTFHRIPSIFDFLLPSPEKGAFSSKCKWSSKSLIFLVAKGSGNLAKRYVPILGLAFTSNHSDKKYDRGKDKELGLASTFPFPIVEGSWLGRGPSGLLLSILYKSMRTRGRHLVVGWRALFTIIGSRYCWTRWKEHAEDSEDSKKALGM